MDDEVLAARPALVRVTLAREDEGLLHELAVDLLGGLVRVLLHDGEQVAEQDALVLGEPGGRTGGRLTLGRVHGMALEVAPRGVPVAGALGAPGRSLLGRGAGHALRF